MLAKKKLQLKFKQKIIAPVQQWVGIMHFEEGTEEDDKNEEDHVK